jgi:hypothetical protein
LFDFSSKTGRAPKVFLDAATSGRAQARRALTAAHARGHLRRELV